jgi:hypothetical protein
VIVCWLALLSVAACGCKSMLQSFTLLYEGYDIPAEWDGLKGKKVAVVCKPLTPLEFSSPGVDHALAERICELLKAHVKDIHIIDQQKVADLVDARGMQDYLEIGKALKAEKVVGIGIESFSVREGPTLFHGRSTLTVQVYDVAEKKREWHKEPPEILYPTACGIPQGDLTEMGFRNEFVAILAGEIGRYFYPHDRHDDYCRDASSVH